MRRREVLSLVVAAGACSPALAQTRRHARVGYLSGGRPSSESRSRSADVLTQGLSALGWRKGETLDFDERWADGDFARLPGLARELASMGPDVLVATGLTETT